MSDENHLSRIETSWETVFKAHAGDRGDETVQAQRRLLQRYGGAVHRYLLAVTGDPDAAADLAQEFAIRVLRGAFRNADPRLGRFRDFLKRSVINLVRDHQRAAGRTPSSDRLPGDVLLVVEPDETWVREHDEVFLRSWRDELIRRAWDDLLAFQARYDHPYHDVLRLRTDRPDLRSTTLAEIWSERLGRDVDANWVRQTVHRARQHYTRFLLERIAASLGPSSAESLEDELIALGLQEYCRKELPGFLARRRGHEAGS